MYHFIVGLPLPFPILAVHMFRLISTKVGVSGGDPSPKASKLRNTTPKSRDVWVDPKPLGRSEALGTLPSGWPSLVARPPSSPRAHPRRAHRGAGASSSRRRSRHAARNPRCSARKAHGRCRMQHWRRLRRGATCTTMEEEVFK